MVLQNCESELLDILNSSMSMVSSVVPVIKNVGERFSAKNYRPVSLLSVVSKIMQTIGLLIT